VLPGQARLAPDLLVAQPAQRPGEVGRLEREPRGEGLAGGVDEGDLLDPLEIDTRDDLPGPEADRGDGRDREEQEGERHPALAAPERPSGPAQAATRPAGRGAQTAMCAAGQGAEAAMRAAGQRAEAAASVDDACQPPVAWGQGAGLDGRIGRDAQLRASGLGNCPPLGPSFYGPRAAAMCSFQYTGLPRAVGHAIHDALVVVGDEQAAVRPDGDVDGSAPGTPPREPPRDEVLDPGRLLVEPDPDHPVAHRGGAVPGAVERDEQAAPVGRP